MRWLALIWKSLLRSKRRTLLIVGSLMLSVFTVAVLQSLPACDFCEEVFG